VSSDIRGATADGRGTTNRDSAVPGEIRTARNRYAAFLIRFRSGSAKQLPLVSPYARGLDLKCLHSQDVATDAILRAYKTDPFLAAKLCGAANSMFFNLAHVQVLTVQDALNSVGLDYARRLLLDAQASMTAWAPQDLTEYWTHCMTVSHAAAELANNAPALNVSAETAALMGLIADIGYLVELSYNPQLLPDVLATIRSSGRETEHDRHASLSESLCSSWSLPFDIRYAIKGHHDLSVCLTSRSRELAALLLLAGRIASSGPLDDRQAEESLRILKLSHDGLLATIKGTSRVHTTLMSTRLVA
jgi:HD-like signal output (HDOD) protein